MNGILLSSTIESITTRKDNTIKIVIGTQEMAPDKAGELFSLMNKLTVVYISVKDGINQKEIDLIDTVNPELPGKSQSQRIRATLFVLFKQDKEGHKNFDSYYRFKTEMYIEHLKKQINS
jgi:hypothetical protein